MISQGPSMCVFNKEDPQEVLASWLFAQYLLSDGIQIAYSQTEGYVPVTTKAQQTPEYQAYLAGEGDHYRVKVDTVKLLLAYTDKTFVTPVFNGSANLRQAAGDLVEESCKAGRQKRKLDIDKIFTDQQALHYLDEIVVRDAQGVAYGGKETFGPLPTGSVALLVGLGTIWIGLAAWAVTEFVKKKKKRS